MYPDITELPVSTDGVEPREPRWVTVVTYDKDDNVINMWSHSDESHHDAEVIEQVTKNALDLEGAAYALCYDGRHHTVPTPVTNGLLLSEQTKDVTTR